MRGFGCGVDRLVAAGIGALVSRWTLGAVHCSPVQRLLLRTNYRGSRVSLAGGPALIAGATAGAVAGADTPRMAVAATVAGLGAGAVGVYDDLASVRPEQRSAKGFHGHLGALREGRVTSGMVKIAGVGVSGLVAAAIMASERGGRTSSRPLRAAELLLDAGIIAGSANLVNLLDLRPGRALKAGLLAGGPMAAGSGLAGASAAGAVGAATAMLPEDLGEQTMLGDGGANALGALLGTAMVARTRPAGKIAAFCGILGLTLASERISFTKVIAETPVLRELDSLGRSDRARPSTPTRMP